MTTFENAKVNDRVYSLQYGWGIIEEINIFNNFQLNVKFDDYYCGSYNYYGLEYRNIKQRDLYWDRPEIIAPEKPKMTKENVNLLKSKLSSKVQKLIDDFEYETGLFVTNISVIKTNNSQMLNEYVQKYENKLEINLK